MDHQPSRRTVLIGTGAVGAAAIAGCGAGSRSSATTVQRVAAGTEAAAIAQLADIPVGGAVVVTDGGKPVVLSQPTAGVVKAFSALCTHKGCKVVPAGALLNCPCHNSVFNAVDGSVVKGPATTPLPTVAVKVVGAAVLPA